MLAIHVPIFTLFCSSFTTFKNQIAVKSLLIMRTFLIFFLLLPAYSYLNAQTADNSFKFQQLNHEKVKEAYLDKENQLKKLVVSKGISSFANHIYLRVFKNEEVLELWIKPPSENQFILLKKYKLCEKSGTFGPKKLKGDKQIPEGFYSINEFRHDAKYLLGLSINYPNEADLARGSAPDDVSLHGGCKSRGTIPLTDEGIQELYVMAVEARAAGQEDIPIHIFPAYMTNNNVNKLKGLFPNKPGLYSFWDGLQQAFISFNRSKRLPDTSQDPAMMVAVEDLPAEAAPIPAVAVTVPPEEMVASARPAVAYRGAVPSNEAAAVVYRGDAEVMAAAAEQVHEVRSGQTLFSISQSYGITVPQLKQWNSLLNNTIKIGQKLQVSPPAFYTVKKGDTLYSIAKKNEVSVEELLKWNNKKGYNLLVGEVVRVRI